MMGYLFAVGVVLICVAAIMFALRSADRIDEMFRCDDQKGGRK